MDKKNQEFGFWRAIESMFSKLIDKGVIIALGLIFLAAFMIYKTPSKDIINVWDHSLNVFEAHYILGWVISFIEPFFFLYRKKSDDKKYIAEIERMAKQKAELEKLLLENRTSSKKQK